MRGYSERAAQGAKDARIGLSRWWPARAMRRITRLAAATSGAVALCLGAGAVLAQPAPIGVRPGPVAAPGPAARPTPTGTPVPASRPGPIVRPGPALGVIQRPGPIYDIGIRKSGPVALTGGQTATFSLSSINVGPSTVVGSDGVKVVDTLPGNFTGPVMWTTSSDWTCSVTSAPPYTVSCVYNGPPVSAGGAFPPITITATATTPGTYTNCAKIGMNAHPDTDYGNNQSCVPGQIGAAHPVVIKKLRDPCAPPNQTSAAWVCTFDFAVINNTPFPFAGPTIVYDTVTPAASVTVTNVTPNSWTCSGAPVITCQTLVGVPANGVANFSATFLIYGISPPTRNCVRLAPLAANPDYCIPIIIARPALVISKLVVQDCSVNSNLACEFIVRITNNGPGTYSGPLTFTDTINSNGSPTPGVSLVPPFPSGWTCTGIQPLTCASGAVIIAVGGYVDIPLSMKIISPINADHNCASLTVPQPDGPACVPIASPHYDVRLDSAFRSDPQSAGVGVLTYYISSTPQLVPGAHIHVSGSLDGGVPFGGTPASPGWICSGGWANFQCDRAVPAGYVGPFLLLELHTTYPPSFLGHTFTYSGTATMGSNIDPNPANNTRTVTGPLH